MRFVRCGEGAAKGCSEAPFGFRLVELNVSQLFGSRSHMATTFVFLVGSDDPELYTMSDGVKRPKRELPIEEVMNWAESDPIWANRGKAIQGYAQLESSLCSMMAELGGIPRETSLTIFFKITSTGSRNSILEKLLHAKHGSKFNLFWNCFFKELRPIDTKRNEIVHWLAAANANLDAENVLHVGVTLIPPSSASSQIAGPILKLTSKDLIAFAKKCDDFSRLANMFLASTSPSYGADPESMKPWLDIFQQPLVYPLPEDHLLFQKPQVPDNQPQPSQA